MDTEAPQQHGQETMEIAPGVFLVDRVRGSNVYLLVDSRLALIDTGMPDNSSTILSFIRSLGRDPGELAHIVVTHGHIDHAGSAAALRRLTEAKVVAHRDEVALTHDGACMLEASSSGRYGPAMRALSRIGRFEPCPVEAAVNESESLPYLGGLRIIHAPGHTRGSLCLLLEKRGILFVGDTIINNKDRLSRPLPFGADRDQSEQSLAKLAQLDFSTCCFGHGPPLTSAARITVAGFVNNSPHTPLWRRIVKRRHTLVGFGLRLWRR